MNNLEAARRIRQHNEIHQRKENGMCPMITEALNMGADALDEIAAMRAENERLRAALAAAEKTIYDAETYFDMGSAKYAYKQIKDYQTKKEAARAALGKEDAPCAKSPGST